MGCVGLLRKYIVIVLLLVSGAGVAQTDLPYTLQRGDVTLHGSLMMPKRAKKQLPIVVLHAGSGPTDRNGNSVATQNNCLKQLATMLAKNGIASLRYDKRGIAESVVPDLKEENLRFETYIDDLAAVVDSLRADVRFSSIILCGHSEGALITLAVAAQKNDIAGYVSLAGCGETADHVLKEQLSGRLSAKEQQRVFAMLDSLVAGDSVRVVPKQYASLFRPSVQPYLKSWFRYNPQTLIARLHIPILIAQGGTDKQVAERHALLLKQAAPAATYVFIPSMNHVLKDCSPDNFDNQRRTYTDPTFPLNKQLVKAIVRLVKQVEK